MSPDPTTTATTGPLPPGTRAPDFVLPQSPDSRLRLADLRGRPVVIAFYPADWSPVCGDELSLFNEVLDDLRQYGAELIGISVDGAWCHKAYAEARHLRFPLLADFEPKGTVSKSYGAYRYGDGFSERALFVLDGDGMIRWSYLSPLLINPGADGVLAALEAMTPRKTPTGAPS
jgi:peroxiredoxin